MGLSQGLRAGQAIVIVVLFARILKKEEFGDVAYAMTMSQLFLPVFEFGSHSILVREFSRENSESSSWLSAAVQAKFFASLLICPVSYLLSWLLDGGGHIPLLTMLFSLNYLFRICEPFEMWSISRQKFSLAAIARAGSFFVMAGVMLVALYRKMPAEVCVLIYSLSFVVYSTLMYILTKRFCKPPRFEWVIRPRILMALFRESSPLMVSGLAVVLYVRLDSLMLKQIHGPVAVATYLAAARLSQGLYLIPGVIADVMFPRLVKDTANRNELEDLDLWRKAMTAQLQLATLVIILAVLTASIVIPMLYGSAYLDAVGIFRIHACSMFPVTIGIVTSKYLISHRLQKLNTLSTITGLAVNAALNALLIPRYSYWGAAISTLISFTCGGTLFYFFIPSGRTVFLLQMKAIGRILSFRT